MPSYERGDRSPKCFFFCASIASIIALLFWSSPANYFRSSCGTSVAVMKKPPPCGDILTLAAAFWSLTGVGSEYLY